MRAFFLPVCALISGASVATGIFLIGIGSPVVALLPILISPVCMWIIRSWLEYGQPRGLFNFRTQAYAFLFGDTVVLPTALVFIALGWQELSRNHYQNPWWMIVLALVAACGLMYAWSAHEADSYAEFGERDRVTSPSKLWHDRVVYPILSFLLVWGGVPVVITQPLGWGAAVIVTMIVWAALGWYDGERKLPPSDLHPRVQDTRLK